jgi:hypothetical protein
MFNNFIELNIGVCIRFHNSFRKFCIETDLNLSRDLNDFDAEIANELNDCLRIVS